MFKSNTCAQFTEEKIIARVETEVKRKVFLLSLFIVKSVWFTPS